MSALPAAMITAAVVLAGLAAVAGWIAIAVFLSDWDRWWKVLATIAWLWATLALIIYGTLVLA